MVANGEGGDGRRREVRCLAWRSGQEQVACVRLPAAVDGTADEALEVARDELRLRSDGLHAIDATGWYRLDLRQIGGHP